MVVPGKWRQDLDGLGVLLQIGQGDSLIDPGDFQFWIKRRGPPKQVQGPGELQLVHVCSAEVIEVGRLSNSGRCSSMFPGRWRGTLRLRSKNQAGKQNE